MKTLGYYNGTIDEVDKIMIPMNDRVHWFGDGVYDAGPCRNYHIFALDEHLDRLYNSAGLLKIRMPLKKEELKDLLNTLVRKMDTGNIFVYVQVTRGTEFPRAHVFPDPSVPANLWITLTPQVMSDGRTPIRLITVPDTRFFHCNIKTLNLIPSVMASQKAKEAGCQEAVFYRAPDRVTECAHSNVSILKDGVLRTAPTDNLILPGTARAHLIRSCKRLGIPVDETAFTLRDLFEADEIIVTSSSNLCMHADSIDGKPAGGKAQDLLSLIRADLFDEFNTATAEDA